MAQPRPLDSAFPIDRRLAVAASDVVVMNIFTVDAVERRCPTQGLGGGRTLDEEIVGIHLGAAPSGRWR
jgi:hypothetical protein